MGEDPFCYLSFLFQWCHQESNRGHKDFQSFALPTELWHHWQFFFLGAEATRFELVVRLPVRQFSKLLVSATHPHFQSHSALELRCKDRAFFLILQILPSLSLQIPLLFARRGGVGRSEPPHNYPNKGDLLRLVYIRYVRAYGGEGKAEKLCLSEQKSLPEVEEKHSLR